MLPDEEDCYIYKRPTSQVWQYYLSIPGEGEERKSTKVKGKESDPDFGKKEAKKFALDRKLEVMARHQQGLKARRVKKMFDFIQDFLEEEEKRIAPYPQKGKITQETFRVKKHHLALLKKFYHDRSIKLEDLDYPKLYNYPVWRTQVDPVWNPKVPKTNHTILTELTTIRSYFDYLLRLGYISRKPDFHKVERESLRNNRRDYLSPIQYKQTINTIRAYALSKSTTDNQRYNRGLIYQSLLIMANACLRKGEMKGLRWFDIEMNPNISKVDQQIGHLIRIRAEISKTGEPRVVQAPTAKRFDELRKLAGIPKHPKSPWPHIPPERRNDYVMPKYNKPDKPLGLGTWNRVWTDIRELCADRYWGQKNISYYSFRHTGISFAVSRSVPMLLLSRNAGTGVRYIQDVYYHHESESRATWDTLNQNRYFTDSMKKHRDDLLLELEEVLSKVDF